MRRLIIKEGPLVFLRNVLLMELVAAALFYALSLIGNYEMLYRGWGLDEYLRYDIFLMIAFSAFQLGYIILLFFDWYLSHFELHEREIVRKSGLLFRRRRSVSLADVAAVEVYQSPLSRFMHHATIIIEHQNGRQTKLKNIGNFEENLHLIKQIAQSASGRLLTHDVRALIDEGESRHLEFKETLRYDARKGESSKELEHAVVKTIVGFLNADGGTLLIGVKDDCTVGGLDGDYKALPKKNRDGFENHLGMLIKTMIGLPFAKYVSAKFESVEGKDICVVTVRESHKPAYLKNGDRREEFFVRVGNSTQPFTMSEAEEYIKGKWK